MHRAMYVIFYATAPAHARARIAKKKKIEFVTAAVIALADLPAISTRNAPHFAHLHSVSVISR